MGVGGEDRVPPIGVHADTFLEIKVRERIADHPRSIRKTIFSMYLVITTPGILNDSDFRMRYTISGGIRLNGHPQTTVRLFKNTMAPA
jgi:hypothetical protein